MSNSFPTPPGSWLLGTITYTISSSYQRSSFNPIPSTTLDFGAGVGTSLLQPAGFNINPTGNWGSVVFSFTTPGTFGSFSQSAAEAQVIAMVTDWVNGIVALYGDTAANVKAVTTCGRTWYWTDESQDYILTFNDTLNLWS